MALTLTQDYKDALGTSFQENWLFEIRNNTYSSGSATTEYIRLGTIESGSGNSKYNAFITNQPTLRESIDLEKGSGKVGNLSINCVNQPLSNHSNTKLSEEILGGSRYYLNHQVIVYSSVGGYNLKIFTGRLKDVTIGDNHLVTLQIASATPIDFIQIPDKQSNAGNYFPVAYGNYKQAPESTVDNPAFIDSDTDTLLFPVTVDSVKGEVGYNCLFHADITTVFGNAVDSGKDLDGVGNQQMFASASDNRFQVINSTTSTVFNAGDVVQIDNEKMLVTNSTLVPSIFEDVEVVRGFAGTTIEFHADGSSVFNIPLSSGSSKLHYPVADAFRNADDYPLFAPLNASSGTIDNIYETQNASGNLIADNDRKVTRTALDLERRYKYRPKIDDVIINTKSFVTSGFSSDITSSITEESLNNRDKAVDTSTSSFAQFTHSVSYGSGVGNNDVDVRDIFNFVFNNTKEDHKVTEYKLTVVYDVASYTNGLGNSDSQTSYEVQLNATAKYGDGQTAQDDDISFDANTTNRTKTFDFLNSSDFSNADGNPPNEIKLGFEFFADNGQQGESCSSVVKIKDIYFTIRAKISPETDSDVNPLEHESAVKAVKKLYSGGVGASKSFGSGVVENIVDMHRDILSRHAGISSSANDVIVNTGTYANLVTARSSWKVAYWLDKPTDITRLLKQAQYEGGFIFRFRTSDETPQYIYIPDGTISADHIIDLNDISSYNVKVTPMDKLITKRVIKYKRNPINNQHLKEQTSEDTSNTVRTNYNVQTNENIQQDKLDILISGIGAEDTGTGNRNDGFANYYQEINGEPKYIVNVEINETTSSGVSDYFYGMEVGDFAKFGSTVLNTMPKFGNLTTSTIFIVTSITRGIGSLKVTLRQV